MGWLGHQTGLMGYCALQVLRGATEVEKLLEKFSINAANPAVIMTQDTARRYGDLLCHLDMVFQRTVLLHHARLCEAV